MAKYAVMLRNGKFSIKRTSVDKEKGRSDQASHKHKKRAEQVSIDM